MSKHSAASSQFPMLAELVWQRNLALAPLLQALGKRPLSLTERETLRDLLLEEMLAKGLGPDDEPNELGRQLDDEIGRLMSF